jgi:hypothetical protein
VQPERVAHWTWEDRAVGSLGELRQLAKRGDLGDRVVRLRVEMRVPAPEYDEAEKLLEELVGTAARQGRVGVLELDRQGLELETGNIEEYCADLPAVLQSTVQRLKAVASADPQQRAPAERALFHLYKTTRKKAS